MTEYALTDIPPSAQKSLEALAVWVLETLEYLNPDSAAMEYIDPVTRDPVPVRSAQNQASFNDTLKPGSFRYLGRLSLELKPEYKVGNTWGYVKELSTKPLPDFLKK